MSMWDFRPQWMREKPLEFVPPEPTPVKKLHGSEADPCWCDECFNVGQRLRDRAKDRRTNWER